MQLPLTNQHVGWVRLYPPSRMEWQVKVDPPYQTSAPRPDLPVRLRNAMASLTHRLIAVSAYVRPSLATKGNAIGIGIIRIGDASATAIRARLFSGVRGLIGSSCVINRCGSSTGLGFVAGPAPASTCVPFIKKEPGMKIPFFKEMKIGAYLLRQKILGRKRYPLVLMLEPLFRCNLACVGCGKIDYPDPILNRRLSVDECLAAVDECGAPMVAIPGGEPLIHKDIGAIVRGIVARKQFVSLCTNALLLEKKLDQFEPSPYLFFSVHLDGLREHHDKSVSQPGVFDRAVSAIRAAKTRGFAVNVNATIFDGHSAQDVAAFLDFAKTLDVGVSISPGYAYERAPDQEHFLSRRKTKQLFRDVFAFAKGKKWNFMHSGLFLDFLAGNQEYECTPWGMPARNIFGWQKPCYLLGEGYAKTFQELMETTDWDSYGTGKYEKCADCMAHCGYEPTAATAALNNPFKAMWVALRGVKTTGPLAPEIDLSRQRPAQYIFSEQVQKKLSEIRRDEALAAQQKAVQQNAASTAA